MQQQLQADNYMRPNLRANMLIIMHSHRQFDVQFATHCSPQGLSRTPLQLLRLPQLVWYLLRLPLADTPRQQRRLWAEQQTLLGYTLPLHTLVLLLGLVFCVASPLIAPVTLLYFVSSSVAQRYQWIYIYRHPYEGAGTLWRQVFTQVRRQMHHGIGCCCVVAMAFGCRQISLDAGCVTLTLCQHAAEHGALPYSSMYFKCFKTTMTGPLPDKRHCDCCNTHLVVTLPVSPNTHPHCCCRCWWASTSLWVSWAAYWV
jgi:hypothetical protein